VVFAGPCAAIGASTATLAWNPVTDPRLTGYVLFWGTNSGNYIWSVACPSNQTSVTVSSLLTGQPYYFVVESESASGPSDFSTEVAFTNATTITTITNIIPPPAGTNSQSSTNGGGNSGGHGSGGNNPPPASLPVNEFLIAGMPPKLSLARTNSNFNLTIQGTVGAEVVIQSTTNPAALGSWVTIDEFTLTNPAPALQTNQIPDLLAAAFAPASQTCDVSPSNSSPFQFYRTVMQHGYITLADTILPTKGYGARLIVVNMPGFIDAVCYASPDNCLIFLDQQTYGVGFESAGSTIRQIASTYASSLSLNWTSASELSYSNGLGSVLATVVETENPASDPVAGQNGTNSTIVIDF